MILRFCKMQGAGNDFIVIDARAQDETFDVDAFGAERRALLANRHIGIGCDQLLVIAAPRHDACDVWVRIFNADGKEAVQCGNGLRCLALYLAQQQPGKSRWRLDGVAGITDAEVETDGSVTVEMGQPDRGIDATGCKTTPPLAVGDLELHPELVSMGNPHAVLFVDAVATAPVDAIGPALQEYFYNGVNVGFAQVIGADRLKLRVWERGVGETRACGTGACAAVVAAMDHGCDPGWISVELPGGELMVKWMGAGQSIWLRGPAQRVFEGQIEI